MVLVVLQEVLVPLVPLLVLVLPVVEVVQEVLEQAGLVALVRWDGVEWRPGHGC